MMEAQRTQREKRTRERERERFTEKKKKKTGPTEDANTRGEGQVA